jgi:uncharacterized protein
MGKRTHYRHGTFSWVDLMTTDVEGAKAFYAGLFGWTEETRPGDEAAGDYTMFSLDGALVAGAFEQRSDQREQGIPPNWLSYVAVDDVDKSTAVAMDAGGTVLAEPFDVVDAGRMSVIEDPQGAVFAMWEARRHTGAAVVNEPGALSWNELRAQDPNGALPFYEQLFGWTSQKNDMGGGLDYVTVKVGDKSNGGMIPSQIFGSDIPQHWGVYFAVEDTDKAVAKAEELGAKLLAPPTDVPMGSFAALMDPQGAAFSILSGKLDP